MEKNPPIKLGEILLSARKISEINLDEAIEKQQIFKRKIGEILIMMGLLNPEELGLYLLYQREIHGREWQDIKIDPGLYQDILSRPLSSKKKRSPGTRTGF
jgi:type IV pilus assembly protein PilB